MHSAPQWLFGPFRLDPTNTRLWHGDTTVALPPKIFDVLHYLVTHPDRLVTKDELLDAVWPATAVSDAVVRVAIGALRKALGETAQTPRYIATVSRRGYRFLAPVTLASPSTAPVALPSLTSAPSASPLLIERDTVLAQLHTHLAQAQQGIRQVVLVTGEPGIGKTAVVQTFTTPAACQGPLWLTQGQCVESYGAHEAYQPVLEALGQLCRAPQGERLLALLRQHAPTWLVQMPWLLTAADRVHLQYELHGATRERMLREFAEFVDALTAEMPLLLLLEDLHWSDYATLDLLAALARRRTPARLLVLGTYRPVEAMVQHHPLHALMQALQHQGLTTAYPLALLSAAGVQAYLAQRYPAHQFPAILAQRLHQHTDGNPLFLVAMVQHLVAQGGVEGDDTLAGHDGALVARVDGVPLGLLPVLDQHLSRLAPDAQHVLEVASIAGVEFAAATVAGGLETSVDDVEAHCEALVQQQMLRASGDHHLAGWDGDHALCLRARAVPAGGLRAPGGGATAAPAPTPWPAAGSGVWGPGQGDRRRAGGAFRPEPGCLAGGALSPPGRGERGSPLCRARGHQSADAGSSAPATVTRDRRAPAPGDRHTAYYGASLDRHQGRCGSRSGADLCPGMGIVPTAWRHAPAFLSAARVMLVLL